MEDEQYIDIAIEISSKAKYPYGAIVVKDGEIIGRSDDTTLIATSMYSHAELEAIESASKNKNLYGDLKGATIYDMFKGHQLEMLTWKAPYKNLNMDQWKNIGRWTMITSILIFALAVVGLIFNF